LAHSRFKRNKSSNPKVISKAEKMANKTYKLAMIGIFGIIIFGIYMAFDGYHKDVYPLDLTRGLLFRIAASSEPDTILADLHAIKENLDKVMARLPENKNPVWIFPTDSTNFARITQDIDVMIASVEKISTVPRDSSAFHTGMRDVHERAVILRENVMDATPYMYVSVSNIIFSSIWIAAILGIFAMLKKRREQLRAYDASEDV
ncbi:MAG: glycosyl transferase, partial [Nitrososphaerota archaeon]